MRLMTNNPLKYQGISEFGLSVERRVPFVTTPNSENAFYLKTKWAMLGHMLDCDGKTKTADALAGYKYR
jgi:3,4-dihydroxy 2-butanone 4-phosphate synthase/GTP cyclohydrolase II